MLPDPRIEPTTVRIQGGRASERATGPGILNALLDLIRTVNLWEIVTTLDVLFICVEVLRSIQQLRLCRAGQLPINIFPGQA